jgi:hypothetical protein
MVSNSAGAHVPEKACSGLDHKRVYARLTRAMGGNRFSDKDMRKFSITDANRATRVLARGKMENRWWRRTGAGARLWIKGCDGGALPAMDAARRRAERGASLIFAA